VGVNFSRIRLELTSRTSSVRPYQSNPLYIVTACWASLAVSKITVPDPFGLPSAPMLMSARMMLPADRKRSFKSCQPAWYGSWKRRQSALRSGEHRSRTLPTYNWLPGLLPGCPKWSWWGGRGGGAACNPRPAMAIPILPGTGVAPKRDSFSRS